MIGNWTSFHSQVPPCEGELMTQSSRLDDMTTSSAGSESTALYEDWSHTQDSHCARRSNDFIQTNILLHLILRDFICDWSRLGIKETVSILIRKVKETSPARQIGKVIHCEVDDKQCLIFSALITCLVHSCKLSSWQNSEDVQQTFLTNTHLASQYDKSLAAGGLFIR